MKRMLFIFLVAAGLCGIGLLAVAQTAPTASPPGGPGFHHHGQEMGDPLGVLLRIKGDLNLNTSQQQQWDSALALSKSAHETIRGNIQQLVAAVQTQVATTAPDLRALAAQADALQEQNLAARKQARAAWLALYDTFSAEQKAVVANALSTRLARMQAWKARILGQTGG
jgi:Spy/CpxP family protein refolding chaperone